jgi:hypothetical protein
MQEEDERPYHFGKRPDRNYVSKSFPDLLTGAKLRIASKVLDGGDGLTFARVQDELVVRKTPAGTQEIKATFLEDDRKITVLTIQKFNPVSGPSERIHFSFVGNEIDALLKFIIGIKALELGDGSKLRLSDHALNDIILNEVEARRLFAAHEELFLRIAQSEDLQRDLVAVGYRRKQLKRFERLLTEPSFFAAEKEHLNTTSEGVWQNLFEANTWIFGYGLSYQFLERLDDQKLEQVVRGADVGGAGKRADALMKTQARISSLCFIEIKRHDTELLAARPYRSGAWAPSSELAGGVAQVQATVDEALHNLGRRLRPTDELGEPTGEDLFNCEPRSFLVVGSLDEFVSDQGINESKFRSFEHYRRNTWRPEILTFDELLHRARFIVEHNQEMSG